MCMAFPITFVLMSIFPMDEPLLSIGYLSFISMLAVPLAFPCLSDLKRKAGINLEFYCFFGEAKATLALNTTDQNA